MFCDSGDVYNRMFHRSFVVIAGLKIGDIKVRMLVTAIYPAGDDTAVQKS